MYLSFLHSPIICLSLSLSLSPHFVFLLYSLSLSMFTGLGWGCRFESPRNNFQKITFIHLSLFLCLCLFLPISLSLSLWIPHLWSTKVLSPQSFVRKKREKVWKMAVFNDGYNQGYIFNTCGSGFKKKTKINGSNPIVVLNMPAMDPGKKKQKKKHLCQDQVSLGKKIWTKIFEIIISLCDIILVFKLNPDSTCLKNRGRISYSNIFPLYLDIIR